MHITLSRSRTFNLWLSMRVEANRYRLGARGQIKEASEETPTNPLEMYNAPLSFCPKIQYARKSIEF